MGKHTLGALGVAGKYRLNGGGANYSIYVFPIEVVSSISQDPTG